MRKNLLIALLLTFASSLYAQDLASIKNAYAAEQYEKAKKDLTALISAGTESGEAYYTLGNIYLQDQEYSLAEDAFKKGLNLKDNGKINNAGLGQLALDNGNTEEALAFFEKTIEKIKKKDSKELTAVGIALTRASKPDYNKAVEFLTRAINANPKDAQAYLALGDAEYKRENISEAYSAYRNAFSFDNKLLRAKLALAAITKGTKAFTNAENELNEILELDPNYGPAYRELAETYYYWAVDDHANYNDKITKALGFYEKYMSLTDYSLESRMRHADFLILAKDYKSLQKEAEEMQKLDKVNPRILRYLGFSAYENGNNKEAIGALTDFISKVDPRRLVASDFLYLAKARMALCVNAENDSIIDQDEYTRALKALELAAQKQPSIVADYAELGNNLYKKRDYLDASRVLRVVTKDPKASLLNKFLFANSVFYYVAAELADAYKAEDVKMETEFAKGKRLSADEIEQRNIDLLKVVVEPHQDLLKAADSAYVSIVESSPTTQDAYFNRARLNRYLLTEEAEANSVTSYEKYAEVVIEKGEEQTSKPTIRKNLAQAYTTVGSYYAESDKDKAIANFGKALEFDPENDHASASLKFLKKN